MPNRTRTPARGSRTSKQKSWQDLQKLFSDPKLGALEAASKPELVISIVGPVGIDRDQVFDALQDALREYQYRAKRIKVSSLIPKVPGYEHLDKYTSDEYLRIKNFMEAGSRIRKKSGLADALAIVAMSEIATIRKGANLEAKPDLDEDEAAILARSGEAYILDSLKNPAEIKTLRATYGRALFVISVHADRSNRIESLARRIAYSWSKPQDVDRCRKQAEELINIDEKEEGTDFGQNVQDTFPLADLFIELDSYTKPYKAELARFFEIIFHNPFRTPSIDEWGMFHAESVSWRSSDLRPYGGRNYR